MTELPIRELGLVGIALLVAIQALQLVPKRNGGKITDSQRATVDLAAKMIAAKLVAPQSALAEAIAELAHTIGEGREIITETLRRVDDLHKWHSPDPEGRQGWKGVPGLSDALHKHFREDSDHHKRLEDALAEIRTTINALEGDS